MATYNRNPLIAERDAQALLVPCPYCKAKVGERCWVLRRRKQYNFGYYDAPQNPHRARIKAGWLGKVKGGGTKVSDRCPRCSEYPAGVTHVCRGSNVT